MVWTAKDTSRRDTGSVYRLLQCSQNKRRYKRMVPSDTGVRQGCILSPLLFAIAIDWVMRRVMERSDAGISWMAEAKLADLDFADDIALLKESVYSMQHFTSVLEEEASRVCLCINPYKCKVTVSGTWSGTADIQVQGSTVEVVDEFCNLGRSQNGNCEKDVKVRIGKASAIFGKMKKVGGVSTLIC